MKDQLTIKEAYQAMIEYLDKVYDRAPSDDLGSLLGSMALMKDGGTMDPAAWTDWLNAVRKIKARE
jgi:hypothetical protein